MLQGEKMITLKDALKKIDYKVSQVIEHREFWVFCPIGEPDCSPFAVKKETGEVFVFFPPHYFGKDIGEAKVIDVSSI